MYDFFEMAVMRFPTAPRSQRVRGAGGASPQALRRAGGPAKRGDAMQPEYYFNFLSPLAFIGGNLVIFFL